ncbi:BQ2448_1637 [Microbotryum intermedium]|uniref:BQ2448_1637 protein n=1 Tax=Microbotryum intermedium TaxID=269621 RepID=A0A238FE08_9BASI|nr:BQ2448_1637 [Microbotryum intermedium]
MSWYPPLGPNQDPYSSGYGGYPPAAPIPGVGPPSQGQHRFDYGPQAAAAAAAAMEATLGGGHAPSSIPYAYPTPLGYPPNSYPPPPTYYGGPAAPPPSGPHPPHSYPHHPTASSSSSQGLPPPPHDVSTDPNAFRRYFKSQLAALSFNSKPLITNLTLFAHEHLVRMAPVVASCLEDHLKVSPPSFKLPALYLLDSISKNIGPPYLALFARFIKRGFVDAYHLSDPVTRVKMEELLGTWRTGGTDGGELFRGHDQGEHDSVQRVIETALFGTFGRGGGMGANGRSMQGSESFQSGMQQITPTASNGERSGLLFDLRRLLQLRLGQAAQMPLDEVNQSQIDALKKLQHLVLNTQLTTDQVDRIRSQLAALAPKESSVEPRPVKRGSSSQPPGSLLAPPSLAQLNQLARSLSPPTMESPPPPSSHGYQSMSMPPMAMATGSPSRDPTPSAGVPPGLAAPPMAGSLSTTPIGGIDFSLLNSLKANGGLDSLLASVRATPPPATETKPNLDPKSPPRLDTLVEEYHRSLLSLSLPLSTQHLIKISHLPLLFEFIYDRFRLQCQQCGLRFFDSPQGKAHLDVHLDWHFVHKRRIREGASRTQGRSWLSLEEDWLVSQIDENDDDHLVDPKGNGGGGGSGTDQSRKELKASQEAKMDLQALRKSKVVAPNGGDERRCAICRDKFKSEWSEDDEEWVYWNAIKVEGTIYHATCYAEAKAATHAARLRAEEAHQTSSSREATPSDLVAAKKRKNPEGEDGAESEEKVVKNEDSGENEILDELQSPLKKIKNEE